MQLAVPSGDDGEGTDCGYATGVFSSRTLARKLEGDVTFRALGARNFWNHRTICEFHRRLLWELRWLFAEVVRLVHEIGIANIGKLSIGETKVPANASKRKAKSYNRIQEENRCLEVFAVSELG